MSAGRGRYRGNRQAIPTGGLRSYKPPTRRRPPPPQKDANRVQNRRPPPRPRRRPSIARGVRNFGQNIIRGIRSTPQIRLAEAAVRGIQRL